MKFLRMLLLAAAALASVATSQVPADPPQNDTCEQPGEPVALDLLQIGGSNDDGSFRPYVDGDSIAIQWGDQGSAMFVIRERIDGDQVPLCLAQETRVSVPDLGVLAEETRPLYFPEDVGGTARVSSFIYLPIATVPSAGDTVELSVTAAGLTTTVQLVIAQ
jgi:hypothetical protein